MFCTPANGTGGTVGDNRGDARVYDCEGVSKGLVGVSAGLVGAAPAGDSGVGSDDGIGA
jgi:hypothetical protein